MLPEYYLQCNLHVSTSCRDVPMIPSSRYKDNLLVYDVNTTKTVEENLLTSIRFHVLLLRLNSVLLSKLSEIHLVSFA